MVTLVEQLMQLETWMQAAFLRDKIDVFNQLSSDRLRLLQRALTSSEKDQVFELARQQSARWVDLLELKVQRGRINRQKSTQLTGGYGRGGKISSGKVLRQAL